MPQGRIELPTSSLPMMRSTTELLRHRTRKYPASVFEGALIPRLPLSEKGSDAYHLHMNESLPPKIAVNASPKSQVAKKPSKEERLKAALRDNLKRRKEAARKSDPA